MVAERSYLATFTEVTKTYQVCYLTLDCAPTPPVRRGAVTKDPKASLGVFHLVRKLDLSYCL